MARRGRSSNAPVTPMDAEGRTVVRAVVHARLLGIRLLSLDAQVVLGPADSTASTVGALYPTALTAPLADADRGRNGSEAVRASMAPRRTNGEGLAHASAMLAESTASLERVRRDTVRSG